MLRGGGLSRSFHGYWISSIIIPVLVLYAPTSSTEALTLEVEMTIPNFVLTDEFTLEGTLNTTKVNVTDDTTSDFLKGSRTNVKVDGGAVFLDPRMTFSILNNGNPILAYGYNFEWDSNLRFMGALKVGSTYRIYYTGGTGWSNADIGLATSTDGVSWTKHSGNPILSADVGSDRSYANPYVYHEQNTYYLFYSVWQGPGTGWEVHMATSSDGVNFVRNPNNPILDNTGSSTSWLYQLARRAAIDASKQRKRRTSKEIQADEAGMNRAGTTMSPEAALIADERHRQVMRAIQSLPGHYREPFVLKHLEGWSYAQIGEILDLPVDTVETRLVRARRLLRDMLQGKS